MMEVKDLDWTEYDTNWWASEAHGFPWGYEARMTDRGTVRCRSGNGPWFAYEGDIIKAKAEMQDDYRNRVLECIAYIG